MKKSIFIEVLDNINRIFRLVVAIFLFRQNNKKFCIYLHYIMIKIYKFIKK